MTDGNNRYNGNDILGDLFRPVGPPYVDVSRERVESQIGDFYRNYRQPSLPSGDGYEVRADIEGRSF